MSSCVVHGARVFRAVFAAALFVSCQSSNSDKQDGLDAGGSTTTTDHGGSTSHGGASDGGDRDDAAAAECSVESPSSCVEPKPAYADVQGIFEQRCVVCHSGQAGGPWPLTSYGPIADWQVEIRTHVSRCTMPPPEAGIVMTDDERSKILMWLRCGLAR